MKMSGQGSQWPSLGSWHWTTATGIVAIVGIVMIATLSMRLSRRRLLSLAVAFFLSFLLLGSSVQQLAMESYRCHMIEHLAVILIIAPLAASAIDLAVKPSTATAAFLTLTVLIPLYHLTSLGDWVMRYSWGHYVELLSFLLAGMWFWIPVYSVTRLMTDQQRLTYTVLATPVLVTTGVVQWSATSSSLSKIGMNMPMLTVNDVHNGGLIMLFGGGGLMIVHVLLVGFLGLRQSRVSRVPVGARYL